MLDRAFAPVLVESTDSRAVVSDSAHEGWLGLIGSIGGPQFELIARCYYTTHACNLRVRQASMGTRSARNNLLALSTHRRSKRSLAKCAGSRRAWYTKTPVSNRKAWLQGEHRPS
ncbi:MAG: hypothetical protein MUF54_22325 [Polyangiaceae bacterium]|jgi:hypothetical protein|nr:hypothetical protein [Polyangiaceae bacterium]